MNDREERHDREHDTFRDEGEEEPAIGAKANKVGKLIPFVIVIHFIDDTTTAMHPGTLVNCHPPLT